VATYSADGNYSVASANTPETTTCQIKSAEITVVGWIDATQITLPSGANQSLVRTLNKHGNQCSFLVGLWLFKQQLDLNADTDRAYANAWLVKNSANSAPPATIDPV
jgi:hypothetical protein